MCGLVCLLGKSRRQKRSSFHFFNLLLDQLQVYSDVTYFCSGDVETCVLLLKISPGSAAGSGDGDDDVAPCDQAASWLLHGSACWWTTH